MVCSRSLFALSCLSIGLRAERAESTTSQLALRHLRQIRWLIGLFMAGLVLSGITAFPLLHELNLLASMLGVKELQSPGGQSGLSWWILYVRQGLQTTYTQFPFIAYGTDWLAFAHLVLAVFFIGPFINPVKNIWVIHAGLIACIAVIPLALICGPIREIPLYWRIVDCSFGVVGLIPLWLALKLTKKLEAHR
jgi:hypothetical protein